MVEVEDYMAVNLYSAVIIESLNEIKRRGCYQKGSPVDIEIDESLKFMKSAKKRLDEQLKIVMKWDDAKKN